MKVYNSQKLLKHLSEKGIKLRKNDAKIFKKYDYYQVINANKLLFIDHLESIDTILFNLDNGVNIEQYTRIFDIKKYSNLIDLKNKICNKIINKYSINTVNTNLNT